MHINMGVGNDLWVTFDLPYQDRREVIIDKAKPDIRICDGQQVVKVTFNQVTKRLSGVLVDDLYVWKTTTIRKG